MKIKKGLKHDTEKPRWELLPLETVEDIVKVLTFGAQKYSDNNWKRVKPKERYFAATMRHLTAWQNKEDRDPESNLPHLAHALCSLLFLHWLDTHDSSPDIIIEGKLDYCKQEPLLFEKYLSNHGRTTR